MSLAELLGPPVNDPISGTEAMPPACRVPDYEESAPPPRRSHLRPSLIVVAITAAVATGLVGGWLAAGFFGSESVVAGRADESVPVGIAGCAELLTARHLSRMPTGYAVSAEVWINQAAAVGAERLDQDTWQVTVVVDSLELVDSTYHPAELQYFSVIVSTAGGEPSASGVPARIPAPEQVTTTESLFSDPVPEDQAATAIGFLGQYLAGGSELNRYLALPADIDRFDEPPYRHIVAVPVGANSLGQIRVAVTASKDNGITHQLEYVLTMAIADGVWVIEDVAPAVG